MSLWSHNVEKMDEIIAENLPEYWKEKMENGSVELIDIPADVQCEAFAKGEPDYWGGLIDEEYDRNR